MSYTQVLFRSEAREKILQRCRPRIGAKPGRLAPRDPADVDSCAHG